MTHNVEPITKWCSLCAIGIYRWDQLVSDTLSSTSQARSHNPATFQIWVCMRMRAFVPNSPCTLLTVRTENGNQARFHIMFHAQANFQCVRTGDDSPASCFCVFVPNEKTENITSRSMNGVESCSTDSNFPAFKNNPTNKSTG